MKKSRSSVPRFADRWELAPAPPLKKEGLFATAGRAPAELPALPAPALVAIAVGKTKEGESLPAKPRIANQGQNFQCFKPRVVLSCSLAPSTYRAWNNQYRWGESVVSIKSIRTW